MSTGHVMRAIDRDGSETDLVAPIPGIFTSTISPGQLVVPHQTVGAIEVLGVEHRLRIPAHVAGRVTMTAGHGRSRVPVEYGEVLLTVTFGGELGLGVELEEEHGGVRSALAFVAPMSGRFYGRPSPTDPPFVDLGDTVRQGQTVGLLEVMKTFNRLIYQGDDLPESARVEAIRPADGDDVVQGDVILALEPVDEG